ncbi:hypothetical protein Vafri_1224, partial [Volvox africanus]
TAAPLQAAATAAARIASYILRRVDVVVRLTSQLATLPEAFEMARVTGLTIPQVMYNAQMIRTWSLLHRYAHRQNYIIGGRQEAGNLIESPFLMHPIENRTAGLYRSPVATLDFASLYPSLYRAYNLCYTTLVHPDDVDTVGRERCGFTPTGHAFVKPEVRQGILPTILAALMAARAATRAKLKATRYDAIASAVLDSRQKALKITANALYGFTGAAASPLQCLPLADSCLAYGAAACRAAIQTITKALEEATVAAAGAAASPPPATAANAGLEAAVTLTSTPASTLGVVPAPPSGREVGNTKPSPLGPAAAGGRVIYAQTDSVFVHFPRRSCRSWEEGSGVGDVIIAVPDGAQVRKGDGSLPAASCQPVWGTDHGDGRGRGEPRDPWVITGEGSSQHVAAVRALRERGAAGLLGPHLDEG